MINVMIFRNSDGKYKGFDCIGHADYADEGEDIICAGVSAIVLNTINSIAFFTQEKFETETEEDTGLISVRFEETAGYEADLYMKSLVLGIQGIQNHYGNDYITLNFKEV